MNRMAQIRHDRQEYGLSVVADDSSIPGGHESGFYRYDEKSDVEFHVNELRTNPHCWVRGCIGKVIVIDTKTLVAVTV